MLPSSHSYSFALIISLLASVLCSSLAYSPLAHALNADSTPIKTPIITFSPENKAPIAVGSNMLYFQDPDHIETLPSVLVNSLNWEAIDRKSPNFGFTNSAYWFKFFVNNTGSMTPIYIELPIPFLDSVKFFQLRDRKIIQQYLVGDQYPFSQRPIKHQNFVLPFDLKHGMNEFVVRVASEGTVEVPLTIWQPKIHAAASADDHLIQGIWAGIIGIMVIYNLLLFFSIRERSYLYYSLFSAGYLFFQICLKGYGFAYLWPNQLEWNSYAISTFIAFCNLSVALLVINFLQLKKNNPIAYRLFALISASSAVLLLLTFFIPYNLTIRITSSMTMITCSIAILLGYVALFRGDQDAKYFCLAWTATFIGVGILGLVKFGLYTANFWTNNAGQIGVMIMLTLLSFALANRINREKELRITAQTATLESEKLTRLSQEELLQAKINANDELELQVQERTQTMQDALSELEKANARLEIASTTDALTTLFNRGHIETRLNIEFKRAFRHQYDLSIILIDIDHFKKVNDTYGHKAGDECLRHISLILKNMITRSGDLLARYGGEEFIILLVDTPLKNAQYLAQTVCDEIRETHFEFEQQTIPITASFGVSNINQAKIESPDILVRNADTALYAAKSNGRDQVIVWQVGS